MSIRMYNNQTFKIPTPSSNFINILTYFPGHLQIPSSTAFLEMPKIAAISFYVFTFNRFKRKASRWPSDNWARVCYNFWRYSLFFQKKLGAFQTELLWGALLLVLLQHYFWCFTSLRLKLFSDGEEETFGFVNGCFFFFFSLQCFRA